MMFGLMLDWYRPKNTKEGTISYEIVFVVQP